MFGKGFYALFLFTLAWNICVVQVRICAVTKDDRIVFPEDKDEPLKSWNIVNSSMITTNSTSEELKLFTDPDLDSDSDLDSNNTTTTELPNLDNRILLDTLPVCGPGLQLRAGRCRKPA